MADRLQEKTPSTSRLMQLHVSFSLPLGDVCARPCKSDVENWRLVPLFVPEQLISEAHVSRQELRVNRYLHSTA